MTRTHALFCLGLIACDGGSTRPTDGPDAHAIKIEAGVHSTCALAKGGILSCWGSLPGSTYPKHAASVPQPLPGDLVVVQFAIAKGTFGSAVCAVTADAATYCWGSYAEWEHYISYGLPPAFLQDTLPLASLAGGDGHMCGIALDGSANCWGSTIGGKRGYPAPSGPGRFGNTIVNRVAGDLQFQALAASRVHTCGLTTGHTIYCWGWGLALGDTAATFETGFEPCYAYTQPCSWRPVLVRGIGNAMSVSAADFGTCALRVDGQVLCWSPLWGDAPRIGLPNPVVLPESAVQVSVGGWHACALGRSGRVYCWGKPGPWRGTTDLRSLPLPVKTELRFTSISAGRFHSCGIDEAAVAYCWGENTYGELGNGTSTSSYQPVPVKFDGGMQK